MYQVSKHPKKAQRRFYEPQLVKKSAYDKKIEYSKEYLQQVGVAPKPDEEGELKINDLTPLTIYQR